jgi:hypothetical protein
VNGCVSNADPCSTAEAISPDVKFWLSRLEIRASATAIANAALDHPDLTNRESPYAAANGRSGSRVGADTRSRPLAEGGVDDLDNVARLCPAHHREVHHGKAAAAIQVALVELRMVAGIQPR